MENIFEWISRKLKSSDDYMYMEKLLGNIMFDNIFQAHWNW